MKIDLQLSPEGEHTMAKLAAYPERMRAAICKGLDLGLQVALDQTTKNRFSGKGPFPYAEHRLGVIDGRLRASLRRVPAKVEQTTITAAIGSNVKYFGIHEFGFDGTVQVRAHQRVNFRTKAGAPIAKRRIGKTKKAQADITRHEGTVKAHSRRVNIPARAPLSTGIAEQADGIAAQISAALIREWGQGG